MGIFPLSVQDHLALADTSYGPSSSRDRANEVAVLQTSAWWPQEQARTVKGQADVGHDGPTPSLIPEERLPSLHASEQAQDANQLLLSPISSLVPFFQKISLLLSYQLSLHCCPSAQCVPKLKVPESM